MSHSMDEYFDQFLPPVGRTRTYFNYAETYEEAAEVYDDVATWAAGSALGDEAVVRRDAAAARGAQLRAEGSLRPIDDPGLHAEAQ